MSAPSASPRLKDGPYQGRVLVKFTDGHELLMLTKEERRHAGGQFYCLKGLTHWIPADQFRKQAADLEAKAGLLRTAAECLARVGG